MKVIPDGLPSNTQVDNNSEVNNMKLDKRDNQREGNMEKSNIKIKPTPKQHEGNDSSSDDEECNTNVNNDKPPKENDTEVSREEEKVNDLTAHLRTMKVSSQKEDGVKDITSQLSAISVKEKDDGRRSPQLLSRGPDGGKPAAYNHLMYGQQDWTCTQASVRIKGMSGKRGFEDETNPYKYSRNIEPVENGDYTDLSYMDPMAQTMAQQQQQPLTHTGQPMSHHFMVQQNMQRPIAHAYRRNLNNLNAPQTSSYQGFVMPSTSRNMLSGGSVTINNQEPSIQQSPVFNTDQCASGPDWDPDGLLEWLGDSDVINGDIDNNFVEEHGFTPKLDNLAQQSTQQFKPEEQITSHQLNQLQKTKRNLSGDESGYDSEVSRMSTSTSPYSPDNAMSPESQSYPPSVGQAMASPYCSHLPFCDMSNIASPRSVDSGISAGSPSAYGDVDSPASHMSAMSPGNIMSVESPMPSPASNLSMTCTDSPLSDPIMSELNMPIPHSSVDKPVGKYIDDNLSRLKDVYDVIATELQNEQHKKADRSQSGVKVESESKLVNSQMSPVTNMLPPSSTNTALKQEPAVSSKQVNIPTKVPVTAMPVSNSTMTPVILQPVTAGGTQITPVVPQTTKLQQQPPVVQVGQGAKMPVVGQPIVPVSAGQNIVWVPVNTTQGVFNPTGPAPIIVVRQAQPVNQKKGGPTKPRPILPKMPTVMPGTSKSSTSITASTNRTSASSPSSAKTQTVPSNTPTIVNGMSHQNANVPKSKVAPMPVTMTPTLMNGNGHFQPQQTGQQLQSPIQGQGMSMPCGLAPGVDSCGPNKLNLARRYVAEMKKEDLHCQDQDGDTYLHVAICRTDPFLVKAILERLVRENLIKEMIDKPNKKRQTPLYVAVADNQPLMVRELVQCGADPNYLAECQLNNGMRKEVKAAIHCAAQGGHLYTQTLAELLQAKDIALNLANSEGLMALHCAIQEHGKVRGGQRINSIPTVEMLIRAGADPNVQDKKSGKTPLMYAIETKDYNLVFSMINLIDKDKLRNMLKTQTFDGSSCIKICSGLRMESDTDGWRKINSLILSASSGSDYRMFDSSVIPS